ncbi:MAG: hypothetical protein QMD94_00010, partial [Candidatus Omnitrophota bacterium]|nr:hypothetical protein [Candidatus Omnitrophota bacterium]
VISFPASSCVETILLKYNVLQQLFSPEREEKYLLDLGPLVFQIASGCKWGCLTCFCDAPISVECLSFSEIEKRLDILKELKIKEISICFNFEPTDYYDCWAKKDLCDIIGACYERNIRVAIVTHGWRKNNKIAQRAAERIAALTYEIQVILSISTWHADVYKSRNDKVLTRYIEMYANVIKTLKSKIATYRYLWDAAGHFPEMERRQCLVWNILKKRCNLTEEQKKVFLIDWKKGRANTFLGEYGQLSLGSKRDCLNTRFYNTYLVWGLNGEMMLICESAPVSPWRIDKIFGSLKVELREIQDRKIKGIYCYEISKPQETRTASPVVSAAEPKERLHAIYLNGEYDESIIHRIGKAIYQLILNSHQPWGTRWSRIHYFAAYLPVLAMFLSSEMEGVKIGYSISYTLSTELEEYTQSLLDLLGNQDGKKFSYKEKAKLIADLVEEGKLDRDIELFLKPVEDWTIDDLRYAQQAAQEMPSIYKKKWPAFAKFWNNAWLDPVTEKSTPIEKGFFKKDFSQLKSENLSLEDKKAAKAFLLGHNLVHFNSDIFGAALSIGGLPLNKEKTIYFEDDSSRDPLTGYFERKVDFRSVLKTESFIQLAEDNQTCIDFVFQMTKAMAIFPNLVKLLSISPEAAEAYKQGRDLTQVVREDNPYKYGEYYKWEIGQIDFSICPHIIPGALMDQRRAARESRCESIDVYDGICRPQDVESHLDLALEHAQRKYDQPLSWIWNAEGYMDEHYAGLLAKQGIRMGFVGRKHFERIKQWNSNLPLNEVRPVVFNTKHGEFILCPYAFQDQYIDWNGGAYRYPKVTDKTPYEHIPILAELYPDSTEAKKMADHVKGCANISIDKNEAEQYGYSPYLKVIDEFTDLENLAPNYVGAAMIWREKLLALKRENDVLIMSPSEILLLLKALEDEKMPSLAKIPYLPTGTWHGNVAVWIGGCPEHPQIYGRLDRIIQGLLKVGVPEYRAPLKEKIAALIKLGYVRKEVVKLIPRINALWLRIFAAQVSCYAWHFQTGGSANVDPEKYTRDFLNHLVKAIEIAWEIGFPVDTQRECDEGRTPGLAMWVVRRWIDCPHKDKQYLNDVGKAAIDRAHFGGVEALKTAIMRSNDLINEYLYHLANGDSHACEALGLFTQLKDRFILVKVTSGTSRPDLIFELEGKQLDFDQLMEKVKIKLRSKLGSRRAREAILHPKIESFINQIAGRIAGEGISEGYIIIGVLEDPATSDLYLKIASRDFSQDFYDKNADWIEHRKDSFGTQVISTAKDILNNPSFLKEGFFGQISFASDRCARVTCSRGRHYQRESLISAKEGLQIDLLLRLQLGKKASFPYRLNELDHWERTLDNEESSLRKEVEELSEENLRTLIFGTEANFYYLTAFGERIDSTPCGGLLGLWFLFRKSENQEAIRYAAKQEGGKKNYLLKFLTETLDRKDFPEFMKWLEKFSFILGINEEEKYVAFVDSLDKLLEIAYDLYLNKAETKKEPNHESLLLERYIQAKRRSSSSILPFIQKKTINGNSGDTRLNSRNFGDIREFWGRGILGTGILGTQDWKEETVSSAIGIVGRKDKIVALAGEDRGQFCCNSSPIKELGRNGLISRGRIEEENTCFDKYDFGKLHEELEILKRVKEEGILSPEAREVWNNPEIAEWGKTVIPRIYYELHTFSQWQLENKKISLKKWRKRLQMIIDEVIWKATGLDRESELSIKIGKLLIDSKIINNTKAFAEIFEYIETNKLELIKDRELMATLLNMNNIAMLMLDKCKEFGARIKALDFDCRDEHEFFIPMNFARSLLYETKIEIKNWGFLNDVGLVYGYITNGKIEEAKRTYHIAINSDYSIGCPLKRTKLALSKEIDLSQVDLKRIDAVSLELAALELQAESINTFTKEDIAEIRRYLKIDCLPIPRFGTPFIIRLPVEKAKNEVEEEAEEETVSSAIGTVGCSEVDISCLALKMKGFVGSPVSQLLEIAGSPVEEFTVNSPMFSTNEEKERNRLDKVLEEVLKNFVKEKGIGKNELKRVKKEIKMYIGREPLSDIGLKKNESLCYFSNFTLEALVEILWRLVGHEKRKELIYSDFKKQFPELNNKHLWSLLGCYASMEEIRKFGCFKREIPSQESIKEVLTKGRLYEAKGFLYCWPIEAISALLDLAENEEDPHLKGRYIILIDYFLTHNPELKQKELISILEGYIKDKNLFVWLGAYDLLGRQKVNKESLNCQIPKEVQITRKIQKKDSSGFEERQLTVKVNKIISPEFGFEVIREIDQEAPIGCLGKRGLTIDEGIIIFYSLAKVGEEKKEIIVSTLVILYKNLVEKRFTETPFSFDYEEQDCSVYLGLNETIKKFDWRLGRKFSTLARQKIKGAIIDEMRGKDNLTRPQREKIKHYEDVVKKLTCNFERNPTNEEIVSKMGINLNMLSKIRGWEGFSIISSDAPSFVEDKAFTQEPFDSKELLIEIVNKTPKLN